MNPLTSEFLKETDRVLAALEPRIAALTQNTGSRDTFAAFFRFAFTTAGSAAFMGLARLEAITRAATPALARLRDGEIKSTREHAALVLATMDRIKSIVSATRVAGHEIAGDDSALIEKLSALSTAMESEDTAEADNMPLSATAVAAASALVFECGGQSFTLAQSDIVEIIRLAPKAGVKIEIVRDKPFLRLQDDLIPVLSLRRYLNLGAAAHDVIADRYIIAIRKNDKAFGLVVDTVMDLEDIAKNKNHTALDIAALAAAAGDTASPSETILPVQQIIATPEQTLPAAKKSPDACRVLLVDDSPFFRNMLAPVLKGAGYDVTALDGAVAALVLRERGEMFDAIISDVDMPQMSGHDFIRKMRDTNSLWGAVPAFALTTASDDADAALKSGFSAIIPKHDRDSLLSTLRSALNGHCAIRAAG